ncbi:MAG: hypothetical protein CSA21_06120 [Deltaproteobacteria bacterium]|nr:MAG: hypothetical protein CSA21_06120 [Deltaproteobacteria bacterium]
MWTPSLLVLELIELLLLCLWLVNGWCALRIALFWDRRSGAELQIRLEALSELLVVLIPFSMLLTICSFFLTIFTADSLAPFLTGAMCAFGVFTFNGYGIALLTSKITLAIGTGLWLILNRVDRLNAEQPFFRLKFSCIPIFCVLVILDCLLLFFWLQQMKPDTLVSCCGDLFSTASSFTLPQLLNQLEQPITLWIYTALLLCHYGSGLAVMRCKRGLTFFSLSSLLLMPAHLLIVTLYVTQYAFENPVHRCPFCLLQEIDAFVFWLIYVGIWFSTVSGGGIWIFSLRKELLATPGSGRRSCNRLTACALITTTMLLVLMLVVILTSNYQYAWS